MAGLRNLHALKMTVFSIVTAAFFRKNGLGHGRGPGKKRAGDDSERPPSPGRFTGPEPGIPDIPGRYSREIVEFFEECDEHE